MAVDAVSGATAQRNTPTTNDTAKAATVDYDAFLKLLVAQLKNQDPTNPTDSAEFMAQLASFSNVEQSVKANTKLDSLITSLALTQADGLIGKTVTSSDGDDLGRGELGAHRQRRCGRDAHERQGAASRGGHYGEGQ